MVRALPSARRQVSTALRCVVFVAVLAVPCWHSEFVLFSVPFTPKRCKGLSLPAQTPRGVGCQFVPAKLCSRHNPLEVNAPPLAVTRLAASSEGAAAGGVSPDRIAEAKQSLKSALHAADGLASDPAVMAAVQVLADMSPSKGRAAMSPLLVGEAVLLSAPDFPENLGKDAKGRFQFTLGRMSFNVFEPKGLKCSIDSVRNPILASDVDGVLNYSVAMYFSVEGEQLQGRLINHAMCKPDPKGRPDRLWVSFYGGKLVPEDGTDEDRWRRVFRPKERRPFDVGERLKRWILKLLLGFQWPDAMDAAGALNYKMSRPPHGYVDVLFLDEDLRITRGNRGSINIVERV